MHGQTQIKFICNIHCFSTITIVAQTRLNVTSYSTLPVLLHIVLQFLPNTARTSKPMPIYLLCQQLQRAECRIFFNQIYGFNLTRRLLRARVRLYAAICSFIAFATYFSITQTARKPVTIIAPYQPPYSHITRTTQGHKVVCLAFYGSTAYQMLLRVQISCSLPLWKSKQVGEREFYKEIQRFFDLGLAQ